MPEPIPHPTPTAATDANGTGASEHAALEQALQRLLVPLSELAVAQGLPYATVDELMRRSFVAAAHAAHPDLPEHRRVSRVSAATGLNRREVTRLMQSAPDAPAPRRSLVSEVFGHWVTHPDYRGSDGLPRVLPRFGAAPSFEALAQEISRDVHPRSLLEELLRLGLARLDPAADTVSLNRQSFVPQGDLPRMLSFLGDNVGDHLAAAVDNVLSSAERKPHFEQAVFGQGLSPESVAALRERLRSHWKALSADLVLDIERLVEADQARPEAATQRVRFGLFSFYEAVSPADTQGADAAPEVDPADKPAPAPARGR